MNSEKNLKKIYLITGSVMSMIMIGMNIFIPPHDLDWFTLLNTLIDLFFVWVLIGVGGGVLYWPPMWIWKRLRKKDRERLRNREKDRLPGSGTS